MADEMELWVVAAVLGEHRPVPDDAAAPVGEDRWGGLPDVVAQRAAAHRAAQAEAQSRAEHDHAPTLATIPAQQRGDVVGT